MVEYLELGVLGSILSNYGLFSHNVFKHFYYTKGGGIGAAGVAMAAPLFSSNMGHAL